MTCHVRYSGTPVDETINWILYAMQQIVKSTQFNPTNSFRKEQPNENSLIVEKFKNISHSHPVHHGTFFNVLIDKFCSCKYREFIIFAHNIFILQ